MPRRFAVTHQAAAGSGLVNLYDVEGGSRGGMFQLMVSCSSAPSDNASFVIVKKASDAGAGGTPLTPTKLDPISDASNMDPEGGSYSILPTAVAIGGEPAVLLQLGLHTRKTFRWFAKRGKELWTTAVAAEGLFTDVTGHSETVDLTMHWIE